MAVRQQSLLSQHERPRREHFVLRDRAIAQLEDLVGRIETAQPRDPTVVPTAQRQRQLAPIAPWVVARFQERLLDLKATDAGKRVADNGSLGLQLPFI